MFGDSPFGDFFSPSHFDSFGELFERDGEPWIVVAKPHREFCLAIPGRGSLPSAVVVMRTPTADEIKAVDKYRPTDLKLVKNDEPDGDGEHETGKNEMDGD